MCSQLQRSSAAWAACTRSSPWPPALTSACGATSSSAPSATRSCGSRTRRVAGRCSSGATSR
eukprot:15294535-Alexandrium_andersonii.AAC.1